MSRRKSKGIGVVIDLEDDAKKKEKAWFQGWPVLIDKIGGPGSGHHAHGGRPGKRGGSSPQLSVGWNLLKGGWGARKAVGNTSIRIDKDPSGGYKVFQFRPERGRVARASSWKEASELGDRMLGIEPVFDDQPQAGFGKWSEAASAAHVTAMQKKYPEFYKRTEEHVGNLEEFDPDSIKILTPGEIPKEVVRLTQWDLKNRLGGPDHVELYSGVFVAGKYGRYGPAPPQPAAQALQTKFARDGPPKQMSFTTVPEVARQFTEGQGSVMVAEVPVSSVLLSPFTVPIFGKAGLGESEFVTTPPPKGMKFKMIQASEFEKTIEAQASKEGWGPDRLVGR